MHSDAHSTENGARWTRWLGAGALVTAVLASSVVAAPAYADTAPPNPELPTTVGARSLPTAQINGVAWNQVVVGDTVFVGGRFTSARPAGAAPGVSEAPRSNLLAYRLSTGELLPDFAPQVNSDVRAMAVSPDGTRLYVVGNFTAVDGQNRYRLAVFDTATGKMQTNFQPTINARVSDIAVTDSAIYIVGAFTSTNKTQRQGAAAYDVASGKLLPWAPAFDQSWAPIRDKGVPSSLVISPAGDKAVIAGNFTNINGTSQTAGVGAVDTATGRSVRWDAGKLVRNSGKNASVTNLASSGDSVYGTGTSFGVRSALEGAFRASWETGAIEWVADCHGDAYSIAPAEDGAVYLAGHSYYCGNIGGMPMTKPETYKRGVAFSTQATGTAKRDPYGYLNVAGYPSPTQLNWFPDINIGTFTGLKQGSWDVAAGSGYVVYGGEFTQVNGVPQQGLARFTSADVPGSTLGPSLSKGQYKPTVTVDWRGAVNVSWPANIDYDSERLSYELIKDGRTGQPIYTVEADAKFWQRPTISYRDEAVTPGQHSYRLRVTDPDGNSVYGDTVTTTVR